MKKLGANIFLLSKISIVLMGNSKTPNEIDYGIPCKLTEQAYELGIDAFGIANLDLSEKYETYHKDLPNGYSNWIRIGYINYKKKRS